jgi:hypothetical protein
MIHSNHRHGTVEEIDGRMLYFNIDEASAEIGSGESPTGSRAVRATMVREFAALLLAIVRSN